MLQLKNNSPFAPAISVFPNKDGIDTLYVVLRATFTVSPALAVAEKQVPPVLADEYYGDPATSSIKYASEMHIGKPGTDAVLVGHAWAPGGRLVEETLVVVSVAERQKAIQVIGNRTWKGYSAGFTRPAPFESIPLVYERAFGGIVRPPDGQGQVMAEERNPVGVGLAGKRTAAEMGGQPLPNLEDPRLRLTKVGDHPAPAGIGFVAAAWQPRRSFAGTYDAAWQKKRAPYLPRDFDARFFSSAAPEMIFDRYLQGGEPVAIAGASREGPIRFSLPVCAPKAEVKIAGRTESPPLHLETLLIEPDDNRLCLTWRGEVLCDKQALKVEEIAVSVDKLKLAGGRST